MYNKNNYYSSQNLNIVNCYNDWLNVKWFFSGKGGRT